MSKPALKYVIMCEGRGPCAHEAKAFYSENEFNEHLWIEIDDNWRELAMVFDSYEEARNKIKNTDFGPDFFNFKVRPASVQVFTRMELV